VQREVIVAGWRAHEKRNKKGRKEGKKKKKGRGAGKKKKDSSAAPGFASRRGGEVRSE